VFHSTYRKQEKVLGKPNRVSDVFMTWGKIAAIKSMSAREGMGRS